MNGAPAAAPAPGRGRKAAFALVAILVSAAVGFAICEVAVRLIVPQQTYSSLVTLVGHQWRSGDFIPLTLRPNSVVKEPSMEDPGSWVTVTTNSMGLRGREAAFAKPPGTKRILALGDSYTFGLFVADDASYPAVLESLYRREGKNVEVVNAGFADGYSPDEQYAWLVNAGMKFKPDVVTYGFFVGNDVTDIKEETWVEKDQRGLPVRIVDPDRYADEWGRPRSRTQGKSTAGWEFIYRIPVLRESHFLVLLNKTLFGQARHLPSKHRQIRMKGLDDPFPLIMQKVSDPETRRKEVLFMKLVRGMRDVAADGGARFIVVMIPINFQVQPELKSLVVAPEKYQVRRDYFAELSPKLDVQAIPHLNMLERMTAVPGEYFPRNGEFHYNSNGHAYTARCLKDTLDRLGWIAG
ncbi:MAG: hypothetical protein AB1714_11485 [Acidobacteriota bacterium]